MAVFRWFLILLTVLMPQQFVFAAVAAYCAHQGERSTYHIGHHEHRHEGSTAAVDAGSEGDGSPVSNVSHPDCAYCQLAGVKCALSGTLAAATCPADVPVGHDLAMLPTRYPEDRERPKWALAT